MRDGKASRRKGRQGVREEKKSEAAGNAPLTFAIDLLWCRSASIGGIEACTRNLIDGMQALEDRDFKCFLVTARDAEDSFKKYEKGRKEQERHKGQEEHKRQEGHQEGYRGQGEYEDQEEHKGQEKQRKQRRGDERFKVIALPVQAKNRAARFLAQNALLIPVLRRYGIGLCLEPEGYLPVLLLQRRAQRVQFVTTIHDLQPLDLPHNFSLWKRLCMRLLLGNTLRRSDCIAAVSDCTKDRIRQYLEDKGIWKTCVIRRKEGARAAGRTANKEAAAAAGHTGSSDTGKYGSRKRRLVRIYNSIVLHEDRTLWEEKIGVLEEQYGIKRGQYYYTVSSLLPHKNLDTLCRVFEVLHSGRGSYCTVLAAGEQELPCRLIVSGISQDPGNKRRRALDEKIKEKGLDAVITLTGRVDDDTRNCLMHYCRAFLFPSIYEGFGMPCIEAALCGAKVITTKRTAIPEVTLHSAIYVGNPYSTAEWIMAMAAADMNAADKKDSGESKAGRMGEMSEANEVSGVNETNEENPGAGSEREHHAPCDHLVSLYREIYSPKKAAEAYLDLIESMGSQSSRQAGCRQCGKQKAVRTIGNRQQDEGNGIQGERKQQGGRST